MPFRWRTCLLKDRADHEIILGEEELSDVSLSTFYVFDKESAKSQLGERSPGGVDAAVVGAAAVAGAARLRLARLRRLSLRWLWLLLAWGRCRSLLKGTLRSNPEGNKAPASIARLAGAQLC